MLRHHIARPAVVVVLLTGWLFAGPTAFTPSAWAQALADRVPEDAFVYIGWRGGETPMPGFEGSHFQALLKNSNIPAVFNDLLPRVLAKAAKEGGLEGAQAVDVFNMLAKPMWGHPTAMYVAVDASGPQPMPRMALMCKAGATEGAVIQKKLEDLLAQADRPPVPVKTFLVDDIVGIAVGYEDGAQALAGAGDGKVKSLAASTAFTNAVSKNGLPDPGLTVYVDYENVLGFIDTMVNRSNEDQLQEKWPKIREASGLAGLKRIVIAAGFESGDWTTRVFVEAPSPRKGILAAIEGAPVPDDLLKFVPASATSFAAFSFDPAKFITDMRTAVGEVDPDWQVKMDQGLAVVKMYVFGKDLVNDILAPMGPHWVAYCDPNTSGYSMLGFVAVNKLDDPAKAQAGISALVTSANNTLAGLARSEKVTVQIRSTMVGDLKVNYLAVPFVSPAWVIKDGYLYFSLYPQTVATAAKRGLPAQSILDNPSFIAMRKRLGAERATSMTFSDLPKVAPQGYPMMLMLSRTVMGLSDLWGVASPELVLPPLDELMKHVTPAGSVGWADESGFYAKSVSPFPGAELLAGPDALLPMLIAPAALAGVRQARMESMAHQAEGARGMAQLRQVAVSIHMYAAEHNGDLPPDLGTLVASGAIGDAQVFASPNAKNRGNRPPADNVEDWVSNRSDVAYTGNGKNLNNIDNAAEFVVAYEKPENIRGNRVAVVFADGHVETLAATDLNQRLERQK